MVKIVLYMNLLLRPWPVKAGLKVEPSLERGSVFLLPRDELHTRLWRKD